MGSSLLELAKAGDQAAFGDLVRPFRRELHLHCYRMLGSTVEADDVLQEALVAAWRGLGGFAGRSSLRTWLYQVATRRCLNAIRDARRRPPPAPTPPFEPPEPSRRGEVTWLQPYPDAWLDLSVDPSARWDAHEAVRLAFVAALQRLPPRQSAALLLYDVLGFSPSEVAEMLGATTTAVKGLVQRARASLDRRPRLVDGPPFSPGDAERLADRFAEAYSTDDVDALIALLTDDAWLAMPPAPHEYHGVDAIARFLAASAARRDRHIGLVPTRANGQPAFVCFLGDPGRPGTEPSGVVVLDVVGERIAGVTRFLQPELVAIFLGRDPGPGA